MESTSSSAAAKGDDPETENLKPLDPAVVTLLLQDHCIFCLNRKTLTFLRFNSGSSSRLIPPPIDGYELLRRYFGAMVAEDLNDIYDALSVGRSSLLRSEFPAPLVCSECLKVLHDLNELHHKLEELQLSIVDKIRQVRETVRERSILIKEGVDDGGRCTAHPISATRVKFEQEILEVCSEDEDRADPAFRILDDFQEVFCDETEDIVEIPLEYLKQYRSFPLVPPNPKHNLDEELREDEVIEVPSPEDDGSLMNESDVPKCQISEATNEINLVPLPSPTCEVAEECGFDSDTSDPQTIIDRLFPPNSSSTAAIANEQIPEPKLSLNSNAFVNVDQFLHVVPVTAPATLTFTEGDEYSLVRINHLDSSFIQIIRKTKEPDKLTTAEVDQNQECHTGTGGEDEVEGTDEEDEDEDDENDDSSGSGEEEEGGSDDDGEEEEEEESGSDSENESEDGGISEKPKMPKKVKERKPKKVKELTIRNVPRRDGKPKPYNCEHCPYACCRHDLFRNHMLNFHNIEVPVQEKRRLACHECGYFEKGWKLPSVLKHLDSHETKEKHYMCEDCRDIFTTKQMYQLHTCAQVGKLPGTATVLVSLSNKSRKVTKISFLCKLCDKSIKGESTFRKHFRTFHPDHKPFECEVCPLTFEKLHDLRRHAIVSHGAVKYKCRICPSGTAEFVKYAHYLHHCTINHFEGGYKCEDCGKKFWNKSAYEDHRYTHNKADKKYMCQVCGKSFGRPDSLRLHISRLHDPDGRKHVCEFCSKAFVERTNLNKHIESVHNKTDRTKQRKEIETSDEDEPDPEPQVRKRRRAN